MAPSKFKATITFSGFAGPVQEAAGLPPLADRIRECIETHPTASFAIEEVEVEEVLERGVRRMTAKQQAARKEARQMFEEERRRLQIIAAFWRDAQPRIRALTSGSREVDARHGPEGASAP